MNEPAQADRKSGWALKAAVATLVVLIVLIKVTWPKKETHPAENPTVTAVVLMELKPQTIVDAVTLPGTLESQVKVDLAADMAGRVVSVKADRGDRVARDQVLMQTDARTWENILKRSVLALEEANRDLKRLEDLRKAGAVSASDFEAAQTRRDLAEVARADADLSLSKCTIRSPVEGTVEDRFVEEGEYIRDGAPVFRIVNTDTLKLRVEVPERDVAPVKPGQEMPFTVEAAAGETFTGRVVFVSDVASPQSNTFRVELRTDNARRRLKAGMIASVTLTRGVREGALQVPLEAVIPSKGEYAVFTAENGKAVKRLVKIDIMTGRSALIASGLKAGDRVIVEGQRSVAEGGAIQAHPAAK